MSVTTTIIQTNDGTNKKALYAPPGSVVTPKEDNSATDSALNIYNYNPERDNLVYLVAISVIIIVYYLLFANLGNDGQGRSLGVLVVELIIWTIFVFLLLLNGLQYLFHINVNRFLQDLFTPSAIGAGLENSIANLRKEVFHISENDYTYKEAKAICSAYDAELATYDQIEEAYNQQGEWCSYGWSDNQMALFPTQKESWEKLQKIKGHENDCGRPGVNGGKIGNPNAKFGVNCYGFRPNIKAGERKAMATTKAFPQSRQDVEFEKKVNEYKANINNIMVSPFNKARWSVI